MDIVSKTLTDFLKENYQIRLPIYQREYSWSEENCIKLWNEIRLKTDQQYFLGSIVNVVDSNVSKTKFLIDGQQRITTVSLLLWAIKKFLEGIKITKLQTNVMNLLFLEDSGESLEETPLSERIKLCLNEEDYQDYKNILLEEGEMKRDSKLYSNYKFFLVEIEKIFLASSDIPDFWKKIQPIYKSVSEAKIIEVILNAENDDPQQIFESLNSSGLQLKPHELIKNHLFMQLNREDQIVYNKDYWARYEETLGDYLDDIIKIYLMINQSFTISNKSLYLAFKDFFKKGLISSKQFIKELDTYVEIYNSLIHKSYRNKDISYMFRILDRLGGKTLHPLFVLCMRKIIEGELTEEEFLKVTKVSENYFFRRSVSGLINQSVEQDLFKFISHNRDVKNFDFVNNYINFLLSLEGKNKYPNDREFAEDFIYFPLYKSRVVYHVIRMIENENRREKVDIQNLKLEPILPIGKLTQSWKEMIGEDSEEIKKTYGNTIGNLKLIPTDVNSRNQSFKTQKEMVSQVQESKLHFNRSWLEKNNWSKSEIEERNIYYTDFAVRIWMSIEHYLINRN